MCVCQVRFEVSGCGRASESFISAVHDSFHLFLAFMCNGEFVSRSGEILRCNQARTVFVAIAHFYPSAD